MILKKTGIGIKEKNDSWNFYFNESLIHSTKNLGTTKLKRIHAPWEGGDGREFWGSYLDVNILNPNIY